MSHPKRTTRQNPDLPTNMDSRTSPQDEVPEDQAYELGEVNSPASTASTASSADSTTAAMMQMFQQLLAQQKAEQEQRRKDDVVRREREREAEEKYRKEDIERREKEQTRLEKQQQALIDFQANQQTEMKRLRAEESKKYEDYINTQMREAKMERSQRAESDKRRQFLKDLPKIKETDDLELYLHQLEKALKDAEVHPSEWLTYLERYLSGNHFQRYTEVLRQEDKLDYESAKEALLSLVGCSVHDCAEKLLRTRIPFSSSFADWVPARARLITRIFQHAKTKEDILFTLLQRCVLDGVTKECTADILRRDAKNPLQLITALTDYESLHGNPRKTSQQQQTKPKREFPTRQHHSDIPNVTREKSDKPQITCYTCDQKGHKSYECPQKKTQSSKQNSKSMNRIRCSSPTVPDWLKKSGKQVEVCIPEGDVNNVLEGEVDGHVTKIVLDSGADITAVKETLVAEDDLDGEAVELKGFGGKATLFQTALIWITAGEKAFRIRAAVVPEAVMEENLLLGRNVGGKLFTHLQATATARKSILPIGKTRAQLKQELAEEDEANRLRQEEQPVITHPEDVVCIPARDEAIEKRSEGRDELDDTLVIEERNEVLQKVVEKESEVLCDFPTVEEGGTFRKDYLDAIVKDESVCFAREEVEKGSDKLFWRDGILFKKVVTDLEEEKSLIVLPSSLRNRVLTIAHDGTGHLSHKKVIPIVASRFWWPKLRKDVVEFCKSCTRCQLFRKSGTEKAPLQPMPVFSIPFENVAIDIVGPFEKAKGGYRYLLTYICLASRYPEAIPMRTVTAEEVAESLLEIFSRTGVPETLLCDRGTQFTGKLISKLCDHLRCKKIHTSPFHPQANGCVERMHGTLVPMLRKSTLNKLEWPTQLKFCLYALRAAVNRATGFSPFEVIYGRNVRSPLDLVAEELNHPSKCPLKVELWIDQLHERLQIIREEVTKNATIFKEKTRRANQPRTNMRKYEEGELVLLRVQGLPGKLEQAWDGPFEILEVRGMVNVVLGIPGGKGVRNRRTVHINNVKPYNQSSAAIHRIVVAAEEDEELEKNVQRLSGQTLSEDRQRQLDVILGRWERVMTGKPGVTCLAEHEVDTGEAKPIRCIPYRLPPQWKEQVRNEIEELVETGMVKHSVSPWSSPIVPVTKPGGAVRLCVDYRKLNSVTVPDPYYIPLIDEILDQVGEATFLSKLDLSKGFYQVPLAKAAQEKSAFVTPFGKYEFVRMPFGMRNAPSTFQRLMDKVLAGANEFALPYMDDILIFSKNWEKHLTHIDEVLRRLSEAGLTTKPSKCEWGKSTVEYLGFHIGDGKVSVPQARVKAIEEFQRPKTKRDIRAFLGTMGYYRRFVRNYAMISKSLTAATSKSSPDKVEWSGEMEVAFTSLRKCLSSCCLLHVPVCADSFMLHTDASGMGIGGVLSVCREENELPVAFFSRQLRDRETRYSATELECLAVLESIRHFEVYLIGRQFALITDHKALESLFTSKVLNRKLTRWALYLQEFDFVPKYRPGITHQNADGLSRQAWSKDSPRAARDSEGGDVEPPGSAGALHTTEGEELQMTTRHVMQRRPSRSF